MLIVFRVEMADARMGKFSRRLYIHLFFLGNIESFVTTPHLD